MPFPVLALLLCLSFYIFLYAVLYLFSAVFASDGLSRDKVKTILLNIKLQLMTMAARPFTLALHQHYQTVASSVRTFPLVWACLPGEMIYTDGCGEVQFSSWCLLRAWVCSSRCLKSSQLFLGSESFWIQSNTGWETTLIKDHHDEWPPWWNSPLFLDCLPLHSSIYYSSRKKSYHNSVQNKFL